MTFERPHLIAVLFITTVLVPLLTQGLGDWSYHGRDDPSKWKYHFPACNGNRQSPINVVPKHTIFDAGLDDLVVNYEPSISAELQNNGHTVKATFKTGMSNISGAGLLSTYRALQVHFHWGSDDSYGSEHQVLGKKYPLEIHIVHFNTKYPNASVAMKKEDGLVVLGIFAEISEKDNPVIDPIVKKLNATHYKSDTAFIPSLQPFLFLPHNFAAFYTYKGSLTTPGCYESVQWFLFNHTFKISHDQLAHFRELSERTRQSTKDEHLQDNFRPPQSLNGRVVTRSFKRPPFPCGKTSSTTLQCSLLADDKFVFYEATVNMCTIPATVTLDVSQPDIQVNYSKILYRDTKPRKIGNLDYGFALEMRQAKPSTLHVSVNQIHPFPDGQSFEALSGDFDGGACQLSRCLAHSCNKHWCDGTAIGYMNDMLYIGFSSNFQDLTAANPSVHVNFYHNETGKWYLTASETFNNNEEKVIHLTGMMVQDTPAAKHHIRAVKSQWDHVKFKAQITKMDDKVKYQLLVVPSDGLYYRVIDDEYTLACVKPAPGRLSNASRIAIVASVVGMVLFLAVLTGAFLYCRRRQLTGRQPTLVDQIDIQDDNDKL